MFRKYWATFLKFSLHYVKKYIHLVLDKIIEDTNKTGTVIKNTA